MQPSRIMVTGGHGFVGRHLRRTLMRAFPQAELNFPDHLALDVADTASVQHAISAGAPDVCIHLAAISAIGEARADPERAWVVNTLGTLSLARSVLRQRPECLFIYASSAEIYGGSFRESHAPLTEAARLEPLNVYAATKAAADLGLGAMLPEGLRVLRLRLFNHTGAGQTAAFVVPAFARQVALIKAGRQKPVLSVGALDPKRDFLDVLDVCEAYAACIQHAETLPAGAILNVASGSPRRIGDILNELLEIAGVAASPETGEALLRKSDIPYAAGDAGVLRRLTGWAPRVAWAETLRTVLGYWEGEVARGA